MQTLVSLCADAGLTAEDLQQTKSKFLLCERLFPTAVRTECKRMAQASSDTHYRTALPEGQRSVTYAVDTHLMNWFSSKVNETKDMALLRLFAADVSIETMQTGLSYVVFEHMTSTQSESIRIYLPSSFRMDFPKSRRQERSQGA